MVSVSKKVKFRNFSDANIHNFSANMAYEFDRFEPPSGAGAEYHAQYLVNFFESDIE